MKSDEEGDCEKGDHRNVKNAPNVGLAWVWPDSQAGDEGDNTGDENMRGQSVGLML